MGSSLRNVLVGRKPKGGREPIRMEQRPQSLADSAYGALRRALLDGKLVPGEWLRQETLAKELGVSHITVRDALNRLVGEGLAVSVPYKGVRAIALSPDDLEDIYAIRDLLEGLAAELAAERITPADLNRMRALLPDTIVGPDPDSVERARRANREFHETFIRASGRPFLVRVLGQIWDWMDPMMFYGRTLTTDEGAEWRAKWGTSDQLHHTQLLDALEARDGSLARQTATKAVDVALERLAALFQVPEPPEDDGLPDSFTMKGRGDTHRGGPPVQQPAPKPGGLNRE